MSASMVTTCRRSAIGAGTCEFDLSAWCDMMTDAEPELTILAMNSGSSSLKFGLYRIGSARTDVLLSGAAESVGGKNGKFFARDASKNELLSEAISIPSQRDAIIRIERLLADAKMTAPVAVGHRIVHGGPRLRRHCLIDDEVLRRLEAARAFAPLHIPSFGHPLRARAFSSGKAGSVFRHRVSRRFGGGCAGPSDPQGTAIGGDPTLRVSWSIVRIDRAPTCGRSTRSPDHRPPRQWRQRHRGQSRQIDRHEHGIDPDRRRDHEHA
jgi:hypothetical protein